MNLRTLGGLQLEASTFQRAKPLLLATYLALEGARDRRYVAELFWPAAADHMKSLTVALAQARKAEPGILGADASKVWTALEVDAAAFLERVEARDAEAALALYGGAFLDGLYLKGKETELEEWVYATRELLAASACEMRLELAKQEVVKGNFSGAAGHAEKAYLLPGAPPAEPETLALLHTLMLAGGSVRAGEVQKEAIDLNVALISSKEAALEYLQEAFRRERPAKQADLPTRNTSFVGRDLELTEVASLLANADTSLLTLIGPGGGGKTRLALQVAREQTKLATFRDGVYFVALDEVSSAEQLPRKLAEGLGIPLKGTAAPLEQVARDIGTRCLLMVLDNFEQVVDGALHLPELLRACPNLKLLVTSRVRLSLEEEQVFPVSGLPFSGAAGLTVKDAEHLDAVSLFVRRAKRTRPDFVVSEATLPHVLKICELVEGLPLGLELAAVWVKFMSVADIAAELGQRLDLLTTDLRNVPDRQRSIRSVFDYSWQRLTPPEQAALANLSVFRGGFRREAASQVVGATLPVLVSLVNKSLLRVSATGRYDRHALLYQFTQEKLAEQPDLQTEMNRQHARYYLHFLEQREAALKGTEQAKTLAAFEEEAANIRTAWRYAALSAWSQELLKAATALKLFHTTYNRYEAGLEAFAQGVAGLSEVERDHQLALGNLLVHQADMAERLGHAEEARALAGQGLALLQPLDDLKGISAGLSLLGALATNRAAYDEARGYFKENLEIAERCQDPWAKCIALGNLAIVDHHSGNIGAAETYYRQTTKLFRQAGDLVNVVRTLTNLGQLYLSVVRLQDAKHHFDEARQLAQEHGIKVAEALLYMGLGSVAYELGNHAEAQAHLTTSYELAKKSGDSRRAADSLAKLGKVNVLCGERVQGLNELEESLQLTLELGATSVLLGVLTQVAEASLPDAPEQAAGLAYLVSAHPVSKFVDKTRAQSLLSDLESQLHPKALVEAKKQKGLTPEAAAKEVLQQRWLRLAPAARGTT